VEGRHLERWGLFTHFQRQCSDHPGNDNRRRLGALGAHLHSCHYGGCGHFWQRNRYFVFGTSTGDGHLHALVNNNGTEQNIDLGPLPTGMHHYRIEWTALDASNDQAAFYLDGILQTSLSVTNVGASNFFLYLSNPSTSVPMLVDAAQSAPTYRTSGTYTSCSYDAGTRSTWKSAAWNPSLPTGTTVTAQVRTSTNGTTWSVWRTLATASGSPVTTPTRFIEFRLTLSSTSNSQTPLVNSVTLTSTSP